MEIISCAEARTRGLGTYFTGRPCLRGHVAPRYVSSANCVQCNTERCQTPQHKAGKRAWSRSPKGRACQKRFYASEKGIALKRRQKESGRRREWEARHRATGRKRETVNAWQHRNRAKTRAWWARYNAAKIQATPTWLTKEHYAQINEIYAQAARLGLTVDHQIPLRGKTVCGLHVPWNLQLLTSDENCRKGNRLIEPPRHAPAMVWA